MLFNMGATCPAFDQNGQLQANAVRIKCIGTPPLLLGIERLISYTVRTRETQGYTGPDLESAAQVDGAARMTDS